MKQALSVVALVVIFLFYSGCGNKTEPQPASSTTKLPTTLNEFDTYMIGNWDFKSAVLTFKSNGKVNSTFKSASYSYIVVFNKDHTFTQTATIVGPSGTNTISVSGKWATSTTAGSKPAGSFSYPSGAGPSTSTKPALPFSFILTPSGPASDGTPTSTQICYVLYMDSSDNSIAFDWIANSGSAETWEIWQRIK